MKHLKLDIKGNIAWLEWDQSDSSVNLICDSFIKEFSAVVQSLDLSQLKALVFTSKKETGFCAGADIKELQNCKINQQIEDKLDLVNNLFLYFENLNISKIVAVEGICLGGGLELALCFDYILLSQSPKTKVGLPEVKLGIIPGFGGCFRLPKKLGLIQALKMICSGKNISSKKAYQIGLAEEEVPELILKKRAFELAEEIAQGKSPAHPENKYKNKNPFVSRLERFFKSVIYFVFKQKVLEKTKGLYPAPVKAIELINKTYNSSVSHKILNQQKAVLIKLLKKSSTQSLISLFFKNRQAKKSLSALSNNQSSQKPIKKTAVLGAGIMGQSIACLLIDKGFEVRLIDQNPSALCAALKRTEKFLQKQKKQKKINSYEENRKKSLLSVSPNFWGLKNMDLVIESIPEDFKIKKDLISFVSKELSPECLFASNTSSLSILELAQSSCRPKLFFGLHFFNPADKMPLIELCYTESQQEKLSSLPDFIKKLDKTPLIVRDSPGFAVNRILTIYLIECLRLVEQGYDVQELDAIFKKKGFALGPFETMDTIGLDTCLQATVNLEQKGILLNKPSWTGEIVKCLGLGVKNGKGFYIYTNNKKILNPKTGIFKKQELEIKQTPAEIFQQIINKMIETGEELIKKNIVRQESDINLAMVLGIGFPAFLGESMKFKNKIQKN